PPRCGAVPLSPRGRGPFPGQTQLPQPAGFFEGRVLRRGGLEREPGRGGGGRGPARAADRTPGPNCPAPGPRRQRPPESGWVLPHQLLVHAPPGRPPTLRRPSERVVGTAVGSPFARSLARRPTSRRS